MRSHHCLLPLTSQRNYRNFMVRAPSRRFPDAPIGYGLLLTLTAWSGTTQAASEHPLTPETRIYGGEVAETCQFPTTAGGTKKCTATLIHPKVVISAAHCRPLGTVFFGEYRKKPAFTRKTKWCELTSVQSSDAQICVLEEPVNDLPLAPIIQGCESEKIKVGAKVILSGFGLDENDPANADDSYKNEKRWVETEIVRVSKDALHIGKDGKGGCNGDSGGPAFLQMDDGTWRTLGATHAGASGESHPNCKTGIWKRADALVDWYEEQLAKHNETDIDLTPCFDDSGTWKPSEACGGYSKDLKGPFGAWDNHCGEGMPVVKYSATCGEPFAPDSEDESDKKSDKPDESKDESNSGPGPDIKISSPKENQVFASGTPVLVKVQAKGDLQSIQLKLNGSKVKTLDEAPYEWTLKELKDGTHELSVLATDKDKQSTERKRKFTVGESADPSPDTGSNSGSNQPSNETTPSGDDKGPSEEPQNPSTDGPKQNKDTPQDKGGCSLTGTSPWGLSVLWLVGLTYLSRRGQPCVEQE